MLADLKNNEQLQDVSADEITSAVVHARNTTPMMSGKTPVELAIGRQPEVDLTLEGKTQTA